MSTSVQQQQGRDIWNSLKQALKDLDFISWSFSWLFMFASRIAEPLMTLSVLYIIIEAGVPVVHNDGLHNLSVAIMIASPEIMLPGSFVMASQAKTQGNERKALMLYSMCWIFVGITVITLASLFIFKLDATWFSIITCARCAAGVGYSIMIRVITHSQYEQPLAPVQQPISPLNDERFDRIMEAVTTLQQQVYQVQKEQQNAMIPSENVAQNTEDIPVVLPPNSDEMAHDIPADMEANGTANESEKSEDMPSNITLISRAKQPRITQKLAEDMSSKKGSYSITKQAAAEALNCTLSEIERGISEGIIKTFEKDKSKVLRSSLRDFTPKKRSRNTTKVSASSK